MGTRKRERVFRMKRFSVNHARSACKVGVDGVLVGAWASVPSGASARILDAGCGCGLIALMMAQRAPDAEITGIETDAEAAAEALANVRVSPWSRRITILHEDYASHAVAGRALPPDMRYDLIVSNPPFFHSGADVAESTRMLARHAAVLSPETLVDTARFMLRAGGRLAFICQACDGENLTARGRREGLVPRRVTAVRGNPDAPVKRLLMEFSLDDGEEITEPQRDMLVIETSPGEYTSKYKALCHDFYLKF